jgi:energy-coupling factor transporter ATP-binding protein EcfA2
MGETTINATVTNGGVAGVAGAGVVNIENFIQNVGPTPQSPKGTGGPIPPCPYPGLAYFGPQDAGRFFGREQAVQALLLAVAKRSFTALVGASGSGKSSVVLAGLAPRLEAQGGWRSTYFRIGTEPDKNPFAALARALSPLLGNDDVVDRMTRAQKLANSLASGDISLVYVVGQCRAANPGKRILLIADQFEEVFTLVPDETLRNRFIDAVIAAFPDPGQGATPDVSLVLTLRADFVSQAINYRPLADKLKDRVEYLGPMTRGELREAIVEPAKAVGVEFEPGLVDTILDDVEKRPGSLPLLQFALREMWGRLKTPVMARDDYDAIGGVEGALAKRAQLIFEDATKGETDATSVASFRRLFTRLVTLGEGAEDTRRIVGRDELGPEAWALAQKLADEDNRLIVTSATTPGKETAEVVHEALIRGWPTLVDWVSRDRSFQSWLRTLKPRVEEWRADPTDEGTLLRGGPLAVAEEWVGRRGDEINEKEKAFVAASVALRDAEKRRAEDGLKREQLQLAGLKIAAGNDKYFSFLNPGDPINNLNSYGWKVWSDDYWSFGRYRYYVVIQHPRVRNNGRIILVRILEFDEIREVKAPNADGKQPWEVKLEKMIERDGPVLVLDYSYFGLLADKAAHVGGIVYSQSVNLEGIEFYAPLDQWSEKLNTLFSGETQGIH